MCVLRVTGEQLIAALGTHVDTWLEVILENLASEEAAERHGRDGTGKSSQPGMGGEGRNRAKGGKG